MKIKEKRYMSREELWSVCIKYDWYTGGTNEEYSNLFDMLYDNDWNYVHLDTEKLYKIATDILEHSDTDMEITDIMFCLAEKCTTCFEEV